MSTLLKFALQPGEEHAYLAAFRILASIGFDAVEGVDPAPHPHAHGAGCAFRGAAVGEVPGDPEEICRSVFEALQAARLRPVAVMGRRVERPALLS
jgi:hypothetical protein